MTVHCSFGDYTVQQYFWQITMFRGLRAPTSRRSSGTTTGSRIALVSGIWEQVTPHAEEWRSYGIFPAAVPVPEDAPLQDRLLGLTGRQPDGGGCSPWPASIASILAGPVLSVFGDSG